MSKLQINEHYFDKESKEMFYILGTFYPGYTPTRDSGFLFRSSHKELVQIVKDQLESEHKIISDPRGRNSYWIEILGVPYLYSKLEKMGLNVSKEERRFPENIPEYGISHLIRGFFDGKRCIRLEGKYVYIHLKSDNLSLSLNDILVKYAGVGHDKPEGDRISYGHKDILKIRDFIYQDWNYIQKHGLYLPFKKILFNLDKPMSIRSIVASQKIEKAKKLLFQRLPSKDIAEEVGYSNVVCLYLTFKKVTGNTISEFKKENNLLLR